MFTVVELFAGVGGFRLGFEAVNEMSEENKFSVIWSNQWEPTTKTQHASDHMSIAGISNLPEKRSRR